MGNNCIVVNAMFYTNLKIGLDSEGSFHLAFTLKSLSKSKQNMFTASEFIF